MCCCKSTNKEKSSCVPSAATPPGCAAEPCPPIPEYHIHVDADRDGNIDDDRADINAWEWGVGKKGAIILCNNDGDGAISASDNSDDEINTGNDKDELVPLVFRRIGPPAPADWEGFLEVSAADAAHIRIFDSRTAGTKQIIGPGKGNKFKFLDLNFTEKEFGMEAVKYADSSFNGEIMLTFSIHKGGAFSYSEQAKVRVAPWIMPNHLDSATKVYVVDAGAFNSRFRSDLATLVTAAGCSLQTSTIPDIWMQDCMEIGYSNLPSSGFHTVLRAPRNRPLKDFPRTLRKADFGYHEQGSLSPDTTFDSTGNLEVTPPVTSKAGKRYPWGRIYYGPGRPLELVDAEVKAFLVKQVVQEPIEIDTNWLAVGHVDEIISFVPAPGAKGFKLLLASPKRAYKILEDNKAAHGTDKMLKGRRFSDPVGGVLAEVSIKNFLDTGIPSLSLTAGPLKTFNDTAQVSLDATRAKFKTGLGLDEADIIDVPIIFMPNHSFPNQADALTAGMVNMLVINKHCIVPKPFGPVVGGKDLYEEDLKGKLTPLGLTISFLDDWYEYHVNLGEVHCGTNTLRTPTMAKWWEFTP